MIDQTWGDEATHVRGRNGEFNIMGEKEGKNNISKNPLLSFSFSLVLYLDNSKNAFMLPEDWGLHARISISCLRTLNKKFN